MAEDLAAVDRDGARCRDRVPRAADPAGRAGGPLENLADGVEPADPAALAQVLARPQRLGGLVADLLDLSRVDAGLATLATRAVTSRSWSRRPRAEVALPGRAVTYDVRVDPAT